MKPLPLIVILLLVFSCACDRTREPAGSGSPFEPALAAQATLPPSDAEMRSLAPSATSSELRAAIDEGLRWEEYLQRRAAGERLIGKGPDMTRFVVVRAGDRHGGAYRANAFHVLVGAGRTLPEGSMRIRRNWGVPGQVDGRNEQLETMGIAVAVEAGAPQPFPESVALAVASFCMALAERVPIHPDCVVAMGEIPYTNPYEGDEAERALAAVARAKVPVPAIDGRLTILSGDRRVPVDYELRDTDAGIAVGMMMRKRFDGGNRGMLFRYLRPAMRNFWMKNCFIPIDLAYVRKGVIEQFFLMEPGAGRKQSELRRYASATTTDEVLEMPAGWFERNGIQVGDRVEFP